MNLKKFWRENRSFLVAASLLLVVRGTFADQDRVPSGSMEPTIQIGDHILVNRTAYDLKLPFSEITLVQINDPQRGDIVVFHDPQKDVRMVKRLVAIPGDHLRIQDGVIYLNGQTIKGEGYGGDMDVTIPPGEYFAMGDNRDNSYDSRGWGFLPRSKIVGKAERVILNVNWMQFRPERLGLKLSSLGPNNFETRRAAQRLRLHC